MHATAKPLGLDPAHGVSLRLTGEIPMRIDELATLGEATGPMAIAAGALVLTILFLAVRSPKIVGAITLTVLAGLSLTAASGLAAYGQFNLISVAFLPLFVGLGIDFAIQVAVRYRAEALTEADIATALSKTGTGVVTGCSSPPRPQASAFWRSFRHAIKGSPNSEESQGSGWRWRSCWRSPCCLPY